MTAASPGIVAAVLENQHHPTLDDQVTAAFDTTAGIGDVAPSLVLAKLRALRDGAALASERLF